METKIENKPEKSMVTLTLTVESLNLILKGLGKLPAEESYQLINAIQQSFNESQAKLKAEAEKTGKQKLEEIEQKLEKGKTIPFEKPIVKPE